MGELVNNNLAEDIQLTDEMLKKLKGYLGFEEQDTFPYVPKAFRVTDGKGNFLIPKSLWPIFYLAGKDGIEASNLQDDSGYVVHDRDTGENKIVLQGGKQRLNTLRTCVKGWKNWRETDLKTLIPFDPKKDIRDGKIVDAKLKKFPVPLQEELQEAINERDTLTPEELLGLGY